jgi:hypothetical protein
MAGNKFFDFFNSLLNDKGTAGGTNDPSIDPAALKKLREEFTAFNKIIDANNDEIKNLNKQYDDLLKTISDMASKGEDVTDMLKERNKLEQEHIKLRNIATQSEEEYQDLLKSSSKTLGVEVDSVESKIKTMSSTSKTGTQNYSSYQKAMGDSIKSVIDHTKNLKHFSTAIEEVGVAVLMAIEQFISLNDRLIKFQRASGGALQARGLGFDVYGNNQTANVGSLRSIAENNNLSIEEFLKTFSAFSKDGQVLGLTQNLQESQVELQKYGVSIGRISKLYGVSDETLSSLSRTLSQNYGVKIKDLTSLFEDGANKALQAGINVGKFFDNMNAISERSGDLFIKGGAAGIEQAAFALSKLGLAAGSLDKINDSLKNFGDIITKQNQSTALGLNNFAGAQARIFAKLQTGDSAGALLLQQQSLAKDIKGRGLLDRSGNIDTQGILSLKAAGLGKDEINGIQRLIRGAEYAGVSIEKYTDETKLSTVQLAKRRQFEEQNATFLEKLGMLYSQLKTIFIDPIASVLAPIADILINGLSVAFKVLGVVLKPVILLFQILGNALTKISNVFSFGAKAFESFLDKIGLGNGKTADAFTKMVDIMGSVLAVLIGIAGLVASIRAASFIKGLAGSASGFLGGLGGNLGKFGGTLLKGGAIGSAIGIGGNLLGGAIGGKAGETVSSAANFAGIGATIGTFFGPLGTAIGAGLGALAGAIVSNWGPIKSWLGKIWTSVSKFLDPIWQVVKYVTPLWWIWEGIKKIAEWLGFIKSDEEAAKNKEDQMKIANVVSSVPDASRINAIMRTRAIDNTEIMKAQEKQMTNVVKQAAASTNIKISSDLFGGYKIKAAGL